MSCGIYLITNIVTGQKYVGQSKDIMKRWRDHCYYKGNKSYVDNAIHKYGKENFKLEIITILPYNTHLLNMHEKYWIQFYNTYNNPHHYNLTKGGDDNPMNHPHSREKVSKALKGENNYWYGKKNPQQSIRMKGKSNPLWKDYPRIIKTRKINKKQSYAIKFNGKKIIESVNKDYLKFLLDTNFYLYFYNEKYGAIPKGYFLPHLCSYLPYIKKQWLEKNKALLEEYECSKVSGYYRVSIKKRSQYRQGYIYVYSYTVDGKQRQISRVNIHDLECVVKENGLDWCRV